MSSERVENERERRHIIPDDIKSSLDLHYIHIFNVLPFACIYEHNDKVNVIDTERDAYQEWEGSPVFSFEYCLGTLADSIRNVVSIP